MLLDGHLHFQDIQEPAVCRNIIQEARALGVGKFLCNGIRPEDWPVVEGLAQTHPGVVPFFGVHPWFADRVPEDWAETLEGFLEKRPDSGVGEVGLDKARDGGSSKQVESFRTQIGIAKRLGRPLAIHCVQAWNDLREILTQELVPDMRWMVHSYQGSREILRDLLKLGAYISFSWKSVGRDPEKAAALVEEVPLDRLLLETDFPYTEPGRIGPDVQAEQYCEHLQSVYNWAVRAKGLERDALVKTVWENGTTFLSGTSAR